jgi:hypothetical protein
MNNFEPVCNSYNTKGYLTITQANWTHGCAWNYNTVDMWHDVTSLLQGYCGNHYIIIKYVKYNNVEDLYISKTVQRHITGWTTLLWTFINSGRVSLLNSMICGLYIVLCLFFCPQ